MAMRMRELLLGRPLHSDEAKHQRLSNPIALAVFSSDALSSVAYATEEILIILILAGTSALRFSWPIALAIGTLLVVVAISYRQTIKAYPSGGGAYIVAKENLDTNAGLIAGAALLVDYILTVAVSISAGTAAITSAFPALDPWRLPIALGLVALLALANLRGVKESGGVFAGPTFFFVGILALTIVVGLFKYATGGSITVTHHAVEATTAITTFLILRAFASGCTAMTGVEAIANGVQAFRPDESHNARRTLTWMAGILLFLFLGTTYLAHLSGVTPVEGGETVLSQIARGTFGTGALYYMLQAATAAILVLAANTSYADFPRLGSIMASDGFLPKALSDRGTRLVFSNGMILLTGMAALLLVVFRADTTRLIPLYALGVFLSFTLSQAGMVIHWWRCREPGWHWSIVVNGFGSVVTGVVFVVIAVAKFTSGAWIVAILIPILVIYFKSIHAHYESVAKRLALPEEELARVNWRARNPFHNHVVILVSSIDRRLVRAIQYARALKADTLQAVFIDVSGTKAAEMRRLWNEADFGIRLDVVPSPYRELIPPVRDYVCDLLTEHGYRNNVATVILPEFVPSEWTDYLLHDQTALWLKSALFMERNVIVADVPYHLGEEAEKRVRGSHEHTASSEGMPSGEGTHPPAEG